MQLVEGQIRVVVSPKNEEFKFDWKFNGQIMADENDATFSLPLNITGNDRVEVTVSSDCGAIARASIFVLTYYTSLRSSTETPTTGKPWRCRHNYSMSLSSTLGFLFLFNLLFYS